MMCGLVEPTAGAVRLNGHDVRRSRGRAMAQVGAVLEGTRNVYWPLSPWENLRYFARLKGSRGTAWQARAEKLLTELLLWERRHDPVARFSRGMQQKVAIACALIADPPVVLLDEPTLGLDTQAARTVRDWVRRLAREEGKAVLLTSHQLDMVEDVCDRIAVIHQGRLVVNQPVKELLSLFDRNRYEIRLSGLDDEPWPADGMTVQRSDAEVVLSGEVVDQDSLHAILAEARRRELNVVSVRRREPTLEEVFLEVVDMRGEQAQ
jgi:ABC-2 type transport system ATP-binding protein